MEKIHNIVDTLKNRAEESLEYYSDMKDWKQQELECAYKAACLYEKLLCIEMKKDMLNGYAGEDDYSHARMPHVSYGDGGRSYMRGRDSDTGRYMSREGRNEYYHDDDMSYARGGRRGGGNRGRSYADGSEDMVHKLEELMNRASNDREREDVREVIAMIERNNR